MMKVFFRRVLRGELAEWVEDGLVSKDQARRLRERYALGEIELESNRMLMNTVFLLGVALIGCGVLAFVAAHWVEIPKGGKVALLLAGMLAAHGAGYWFWQVKKTRPYLGHALTLLGTVIFGGNIFLLAQIFQMSGDVYAAHVAWALGALLMAYVLGSIPHGLLAVVVSFVGYCNYLDAMGHAYLSYPALVAVGFLPFCYAKRSILLLFLILAALVSSTIINGIMLGRQGWPLVLVFLLTFTAIWCYGAFHSSGGRRWRAFGALAGGLGALGMALTVFVLSFHSVAEEGAWSPGVLDNVHGGYTLNLLYPATFLILLIGSSLWRSDGDLKNWLLPIVVGAVSLGAGFLPGPEVFATIAYNGVALVLACYGIFVGLRAFKRMHYWAGLGLAVLLIAGRFFEYESHLLIKSVGFLAAGLLLIIAGIKFESRMRQHIQEVDDAS